MTDPDPDIVAAWIALATASRRALAAVEDALKAAGLPGLDRYDALLEIEKAGADGLRPFALQDRLLLPQYGTSRLLSRMEAEGLIARHVHAGDRRGQVVTITPAGRALRQRMWPVYAGALQAVFAGFDSEKARTLAGLLRQVGPA